MEGLLTNNIFFVYLLGILVIVNYEIFKKKQKIAIIYACSYGLTFNNDLRCYIILCLLMFILFLYEEFLNDDILKVKYVTNIFHKLLDFVYMYVFQYRILYIVLAIVLRSKVVYDFVTENEKINELLGGSLESVIFAISILLLVIGIHKIFDNPVELKTFEQINQKFSEYPYYLFWVQDDSKRESLFKKLELVADIEDYTFFERKHSYSFLSLEFVTSVLKRRKAKKENILEKRSSCLDEICHRLAMILTLKNVGIRLTRR